MGCNCGKKKTVSTTVRQVTKKTVSVRTAVPANKPRVKRLIKRPI